MNSLQKIVDSPVGHLKLMAQGNYLLACTWTDEPVTVDNKECELLIKASQQLTEYFNKKRKVFDLPFAPQGTAFQQKVWQALLTIPYGKTCSYQALAQKAQSPLACRAVGSANAKNPLAIMIPCHRVIRASGELGGYAGGAHHKAILLALEA